MFQSITYATKARNLLMKHGIMSDIIKTPAQKGKASCGYSLKGIEDIDRALYFLSSYNLRILGVSDSGVG
jgi:hypothetical protein